MMSCSGGRCRSNGRHQIPPTNRPRVARPAGSKRGLTRRISSSRAGCTGPRGQRPRAAAPGRRAAPPSRGARERSARSRADGVGVDLDEARARAPRGRRACRRRRRRRRARRARSVGAAATRTSACSCERCPARWRSHSWPSSVGDVDLGRGRPRASVVRRAAARRVASRPAQRASSPPRPACQPRRAPRTRAARARGRWRRRSGRPASDAAPSAVTLVACSGCRRTLTDRISPSVPNEPG